jgi:methylenetetrahydrofolate reductase (NADPH)
MQDEAFELGQQWANLYDAGSPSRKLISELMDTCCLVNVVHNDFKQPDAIFKPFFKAGAEFVTGTPAPTINGH